MEDHRDWEMRLDWTMRNRGTNSGILAALGLSSRPDADPNRLMSMLEMLKFYADAFVHVLNVLDKIEKAPNSADFFFGERRKEFAKITAGLCSQLAPLELKVSSAKAEQIRFMFAEADIPVVQRPQAYSVLRQAAQSLRECLEIELGGREFFAVLRHADLLSSDMGFGSAVHDASPSASFDISEAGKCLALRRGTACVMHLMRALEVALGALAKDLGVENKSENWNTLLNRITEEIRSRNSKTHGEDWKEKDEPFYTEVATSFRLFKNAWRNHAMHARDKYSEDEAEKIYRSVKDFMQHLSERIAE